MNTIAPETQKTVKIVGALLLFRFFAGISGMFFLESISNDLQQVYTNIFTIKLSIFLDMLTYVAYIATSVLLFPILKPYSYKLALFFLLFCALGFANMLVGNVNVYTVTKLSQEFVSLANNGNPLYQGIVESKVFDNKIIHFFGLLLHCFSSFALYLIFYKERLLPKILSLYAIIAVLLVFTNTILSIFDFKTSMLVFIPNALLQIILGCWLLFKGFNFSQSNHKIISDTNL